MQTDDLIMRLARRVNPQDPEAEADSLRSQKTFQGDLSWLQDLFAAGDALPMPPVSEALSASLVSIGIPSDFMAELELLEAVVIHDSRSAGELVGVRGAATDTEAWTIVFSSPNADLIIDGTPEGDEGTMIRGHVLHRAQEAGSYRLVDGTGSWQTFSDESGKFEIGRLVPGHYEFEVHSDTHRFSWELDL